MVISSIHHVRQPGAILHPGTLVSRLELDDSSCVRHAKAFTGPLPKSKQDFSLLKVNQLFQSSSKTLNCIMAGFSIPDDDMFLTIISDNVDVFLRSLKDPSLPLLETKACYNVHLFNTHVQLVYIAIS